MLLVSLAVLYCLIFIYIHLFSMFLKFVPLYQMWLYTDPTALNKRQGSYSQDIDYV